MLGGGVSFLSPFLFLFFVLSPASRALCMLKCHINIVIITLFLQGNHGRIFQSALGSVKAQVRRNVDGLNHPPFRFSKGLQKLVSSVKGQNMAGNHFNDLLSWFGFFFLVTLSPIIKIFKFYSSILYQLYDKF